jgi:hypothetical protein
MSPRATVLLAIAVGMLAAAPARSQQRFGIEVHGSASAFAMGEMNDSLASFNRLFGTSLDDIGDGRTWGIALRSWLHPDVLVRLAWEHLSAESKDSGVTIDMDANAFTVGATWFAPSNGPLRYGFGLSLGPYFPDGGIGGSQAWLDASGVGFGVSPTAEGMLRMSEHFSVGVAAGYRWAAINGLKFDEGDSDLEADYTGAFLRLSVAVESPGD